MLEFITNISNNIDIDTIENKYTFSNLLYLMSINPDLIDGNQIKEILKAYKYILNPSDLPVLVDDESRSVFIGSAKYTFEEIIYFLITRGLTICN